jgi:hypothetical protein
MGGKIESALGGCDVDVDVDVEGGKTALASERGHETHAMRRCRNERIEMMNIQTFHNVTCNF